MNVIYIQTVSVMEVISLSIALYIFLEAIKKEIKEIKIVFFIIES